jgi:hypothetical protein
MRLLVPSTNIFAKTSFSAPRMIPSEHLTPRMVLHSHTIILCVLDCLEGVLKLKDLAVGGVGVAVAIELRHLKYF